MSLLARMLETSPRVPRMWAYRSYVSGAKWRSAAARLRMVLMCKACIESWGGTWRASSVYAAARRWQEDDTSEEIGFELRMEAQVAISRSSSFFLLLLRSALPRLDPKRASKWGAALAFADHRGVSSKRLVSFLRNNGGIEGAARQWAGLRGA